MASAYRRFMSRGVQRQILTPQEQALLDKQQHDTYSDLPLIDQQRLKTEVDIMWNQIPEHLQDKAQRLAGLK